MDQLSKALRHINFSFIKEVGVYTWVTRTCKRQFYKRVLKKSHYLKLSSGEKLLLPVNSKFASEAYITNGSVDWGSEVLMYYLLDKHGVFLDVGANIGYYTLYMLPKVTQVYSFEPDPRTFKNLVNNVAGRKNILPMPVAVGKTVGTVDFVLESDGECSHLSITSEVEGKAKINVPLTTIDAFVSQNGVQVEAIKIDVESYDVDVIIGSLETLQKQRPIVLTEAIPDDRVFDLANSVNYKLFAFVKDRWNKVRFSEIRTPPPLGLSTKMLFLIPKEFESRLQVAIQNITLKFRQPAREVFSSPI